MEAFPEITVCGSWIYAFSMNVPPNMLKQNYSGYIENPLLQLLLGNIIFSASAMIRNSFIQAQNLSFEAYPYAEGYKFIAEAAKSGAVFYLESQPLVYKRMISSQDTIEQQALYQSGNKAMV